MQRSRTLLIAVLATLNILTVSVRAQISFYPYAEGTTAADLGKHSFIPAEGTDLQRNPHSCVGEITSLRQALVAEFKDEIEALKTVSKDMAEKIAQKDQDSSNSKSFPRFLDTYLNARYPEKLTTDTRLIELKKDYRSKEKNPKSFNKPSDTQWKKLSNEEKISCALVWARNEDSVRWNSVGLNDFSETFLGKYRYGSLLPAATTQEKAEAKNAENKLLSVKAIATASVFGVALLDLGTAEKPNIYAYFAPSGSGLASKFADNDRIEKFLRESSKVYKQWAVITGSNLDLSWKNDFTKGVPETIDVITANSYNTWATTPPQANEIKFATKAEVGDVGPTVYKKWLSASSEIIIDSAKLVGTCALQKLVYGLFRESRPEFGKQSFEQRSPNPPHVICAAEIVNGKSITVKNKDGIEKVYKVSQPVPSCAACQAVLPPYILNPPVATAGSLSKSNRHGQKRRKHSSDSSSTRSNVAARSPSDHLSEEYAYRSRRRRIDAVADTVQCSYALSFANYAPPWCFLPTDIFDDSNSRFEELFWTEILS